jgi:hypothetical protein
MMAEVTAGWLTTKAMASSISDTPRSSATRDSCSTASSLRWFSASALFSELYAGPARPANHARFVFLDPRAETFHRDWDRAARETAAILRSAAGRDPHDRALSDLVGELATKSEAFRTHWAAHNVRFHATAVKHFQHPVVGELSLSFNRLDVAADPGLTVFTYAAEPGSRSAEALSSSAAGRSRSTSQSRRALPTSADSSGTHASVGNAST